MIFLLMTYNSSWMGKGTVGYTAPSILLFITSYFFDLGNARTWATRGLTWRRARENRFDGLAAADVGGARTWETHGLTWRARENLYQRK